MVSADPCCVAAPPHCIDQSFHGRSTPPQSPQQIFSDKAAPTPRSGSSRPRTREIPSRYKSPTPTTEIPSRYRQNPSQTLLPSSSSRRFASPSIDRASLSTVPTATPSPKRANSAEPRRPSPIRNSVSTATAPSSDAAALPPRRGHTSTRSEILWPSTKSLFTSMQAEPSSPSTTSTAKPRSDSRNRSSSNLSSDHTLRPSPNSALQKTPLDQRKKTPERKGTPVRRNTLDQAENAKPSESFNVKSDQPLLHHRWPSSLSTLKLYGSSVSKSIDLGDRLSNRGNMNLMQARPTSFSSKVIPRVSPNSSAAALSQSFNDGPMANVFRTAARKLAMDSNKPRQSPRESPSRSRRPVSSRDVNLRHSIALTESELSVVDIVRPSEEDDEIELASVTSTDDTASVETGTIASTSSHSVRSLRGCSVSTSMHSRTPLRSSTSELSGNFTIPISVGRSLSNSRQRIIQSGETKASTPLTSATVYKLFQQQAPVLSPLKVSVSSTRGLPSPTRSRVSPLSPSLNRSSTPSSMVQSSVDARKNKKGLSQVEATYLHRILQNRLLQWRFANARADFANNVQRQAAEKLLFSVWARTAEIRKSVTTKRIQLLQARRQQKLNTILRQQGSKLEDWHKVQPEHNTAMSGVVNALESAVLRVPVNEGVKADVQSVKDAMISAVELVHALESSMGCLLPKMERANALVTELAQVANHERTLLEECGDILLTVSCLEVEERSLRTQLLQFEQERARVLGNLLDENGPTI